MKAFKKVYTQVKKDRFQKNLVTYIIISNFDCWYNSKDI